MRFFIVHGGPVAAKAGLAIADTPGFETRPAAEAAAQARYPEEPYQLIEAATGGEALRQVTRATHASPGTPLSAISQLLRANRA